MGRPAEQRALLLRRITLVGVLAIFLFPLVWLFSTAYKPTRAMDNTDHEALWRKRMAPVFVARAVREAAGC